MHSTAPQQPQFSTHLDSKKIPEKKWDWLELTIDAILQRAPKIPNFSIEQADQQDLIALLEHKNNGELLQLVLDKADGNELICLIRLNSTFVTREIVNKHLQKIIPEQLNSKAWAGMRAILRSLNDHLIINEDLIKLRNAILEKCSAEILLEYASASTPNLHVVQGHKFLRQKIIGNSIESYVKQNPTFKKLDQKDPPSKDNKNSLKTTDKIIKNLLREEFIDLLQDIKQLENVKKLATQTHLLNEFIIDPNFIPKIFNPTNHFVMLAMLWENNHHIHYALLGFIINNANLIASLSEASEVNHSLGPILKLIQNQLHMQSLTQDFRLLINLLDYAKFTKQYSESIWNIIKDNKDFFKLELGRPSSKEKLLNLLVTGHSEIEKFILEESSFISNLTSSPIQLTKKQSIKFLKAQTPYFEDEKGATKDVIQYFLTTQPPLEEKAEVADTKDVQDIILANPLICLKLIKNGFDLAPYATRIFNVFAANPHLNFLAPELITIISQPITDFLTRFEANKDLLIKLFIFSGGLRSLFANCHAKDLLNFFLTGNPEVLNLIFSEEFSNHIAIIQLKRVIETDSNQHVSILFANFPKQIETIKNILRNVYVLTLIIQNQSLMTEITKHPVLSTIVNETILNNFNYFMKHVINNYVQLQQEIFSKKLSSQKEFFLQSYQNLYPEKSKLELENTLKLFYEKLKQGKGNTSSLLILAELFIDTAAFCKKTQEFLDMAAEAYRLSIFIMQLDNIPEQVWTINDAHLLKIQERYGKAQHYMSVTKSTPDRSGKSEIKIFDLNENELRIPISNAREIIKKVTNNASSQFDYYQLFMYAQLCAELSTRSNESKYYSGLSAKYFQLALSKVFVQKSDVISYLQIQLVKLQQRKLPSIVMKQPKDDNVEDHKVAVFNYTQMPLVNSQEPPTAPPMQSKGVAEEGVSEVPAAPPPPTEFPVKALAPISTIKIKTEAKKESQSHITTTVNNNLLAAIRKGITLKPAKNRELAPRVESASLFESMQKRLTERSESLNGNAKIQNQLAKQILATNNLTKFNFPHVKKTTETCVQVSKNNVNQSDAKAQHSQTVSTNPHTTQVNLSDSILPASSTQSEFKQSNVSKLRDKLTASKLGIFMPPPSICVKNSTQVASATLKK